MNRFEYVRARSAKEAAELLAGMKGALLKASGTDLIDRMKSFIDTPPRVVSLSNAEGMADIATDGGGARIGALVTLARLAESFREGPLAAIGRAVMGFPSRKQCRSWARAQALA